MTELTTNAETSETWEELTGPEAVFRFTPEPAAALRQMVATLSRSPDLDALTRVACGEAQGLPALPHGALPPQSELTEVAREFAEQFSVDVTMVDDDLRARLTQALGKATSGFAWSCYIADMVPRLRWTLDLLFRPDPGGWPVDKPVGASPARAAIEFGRVVHNLRGLDPVTTELVRLRGARQHNCRLCKSLRNRTALEAGADESFLNAAEDPASTSLSPRQQAALALTDAIIWQPARVPGKVIADVRAHLTPAEATEVVLHVVCNAANKIMVSLDADQARVEEGYEVYEFSADGAMHFS